MGGTAVRIQPPLEHQAINHHGTGDLALGTPGGLRPDVDDARPLDLQAGQVPGLDALMAGPCVAEDLVDAAHRDDATDLPEIRPMQESLMRHDDAVTEPPSVPASQVPSLQRGVAAAGLGVLGAFQLGLAAGLPWGRVSYGGAHPGVLPQHLRRVSAGASVVYAGLAVAVTSRHTPVQVRRQVLTGVAALMGVGTVMNGISPSWPERALWTPTAAVVALCAWRARDDG